MVSKFALLFSVLCLVATVSFSQATPSTQTDKQKVPVVVPSAEVDDEISMIEGRVVIVYDGDHIGVQCRDRKIYSIRFQGIYAPEEKQSFGKKSRKKLADLVADKDVKVIVHKKDLYDRYVGSVYLNGQDVGLKQIENGMAWHFKRFSGEQSAESRVRYAKAEVKARNDRVGLWNEDAPMPPWEYRNDETLEESSARKPEVAQKAAIQGKTDAPAPSPAKTTGKTYILGPRGGCYYLGNSGNKVYVKDKTLCTRQ